MAEIPNLPPGLRIVVQGDVEANQAWVDLWVRVLVAMRDQLLQSASSRSTAESANEMANIVAEMFSTCGLNRVARIPRKKGPVAITAEMNEERFCSDVLVEVSETRPASAGYTSSAEYMPLLEDVTKKHVSAPTLIRSQSSVLVQPFIGSSLLSDEIWANHPLSLATTVGSTQYQVALYAVFNRPSPHNPGQSFHHAIALIGLNGQVAKNKLISLDLIEVGPTQRLSFAPIAPRLNIITGDNGLGKSFLIDIIWWILTGAWAGHGTWTGFQAMPRDPDTARIESKSAQGSTVIPFSSRWLRLSQSWTMRERHLNATVVLYARADGSIAIWDSHRNTTDVHLPNGVTVLPPDEFFFSPGELLFGLDRKNLRENNYRICNGLIADWGIWQRAKEPQFDLLTRVLATLGPDGAELVPGDVLQPFTEDVRHFPSVRMPYAQDVPIVFAPAGVKRMVGLAYALTWAISEHRRLVNAQGGLPARSVVLLIDEPETHLHPRWQRTILPSLLKALEVGFGEPQVDVQMFVATHSPLVLASLEPHFDPALDALWKLDLVDGEVKLERDVWHKRGDANAWLTSDVFDMSSSRSVEAEKALKRAKALALRGTATPEEIAEVQAELARSLTDTDRAWRAWESFVEHLETQR